MCVAFGENDSQTSGALMDHAVLVGGAGPTGLMLGAELKLAGIDVAIIERRASQTLDGSRAGGLHPRTLETLDQRGVAERFIEAGEKHPAAGYAHIPLDISDLPTRHNYVLALWQSEIERILTDWVSELGIPVRRGCEIGGFVQDGEGVTVELEGGSALRAEYLVGCDGGHSVVRKAAGIEFAGTDPTTSWMIAEVDLDEDPEFGFRRDRAGTHAIGRRQEGEPIRVVLTESEPDLTAEPSVADLRRTLLAVYGTDYGLRGANRISRFTDMTRQAASYRAGRVLLAGDAAHVHPPHGGQGLNTGVQDAVNLGWKLAQVVLGVSPEGLLETYHSERHPVGSQVLSLSKAMVALTSGDDHLQAVRQAISEFLTMDEPRRYMAAKVCGLDIHYDLGEGHPMIGRRVPDLLLETTVGPGRLFTFMHRARPVLLNLGAPGGFDTSPWADRLRLVEADFAGVLELPGYGDLAVPPAVLIRPDGHVAWVGEPTDPALQGEISDWFGAPLPARL